MAHYAAHFATVEINNSFHQLPAARNVRRWKSIVRAGFLFAVKASRYITHMKKLKDAAVTCQKFFDSIAALGQALGPVLCLRVPRSELVQRGSGGAATAARRSRIYL